MKKLVAMLFALLVFATVFAPAALSNNGRDNNGSPGRYDNCTGLYEGNGSTYSSGQAWHAWYYC